MCVYLCVFLLVCRLNKMKDYLPYTLHTSNFQFTNAIFFIGIYPPCDRYINIETLSFKYTQCLLLLLEVAASKLDMHPMLCVQFLSSG